MADRRTKYVIAVKREARSDIDPAWKERVARVPDVTVCGEPRRIRMQVLASGAAISLIRQLVGAWCHIEPEVRHDPDLQL